MSDSGASEFQQCPTRNIERLAAGSQVNHEFPVTIGPMKHRLREAVIIAVITAVLLELGGQLYFEVVTGVFPVSIVWRPATDSTRVLRGDPKAKFGYEIDQYGLHPYFGFSSRKSDANNIGMVSDVNYPHNPTNAFIVGVFGGSAAFELHDYLARHASRLAELIGIPPNTRLVILNFAFHGYKQPQQLLVLTYALALGQRFDAVLNFDGFNEIAWGPGNVERGMDWSMPFHGNMGIFSAMLSSNPWTNGKIRRFVEGDRERARITDLRFRAKNTPSASIRLALEGWAAILERQQRGLDEGFGHITYPGRGKSALFLAQPRSGETTPGLKSMIEGWSRSSELMQDIARSHRSVYMHVVQPNQYYSRRKFSSEEIADRLSSDRYRNYVREGYPLLELEAAELRRRGVAVYSAFGVLDDVEHAYSDNCCHYSDRGNEALLTFIGRGIRESLQAGGRIQTPLKDWRDRKP